MSQDGEASPRSPARYAVEAKLGRGGMGTVYRVRDRQAGRCVALKRVSAKSEHDTAKRTRLLEREYHTLQQLRHPRIIEVYDYGIDDRGAYYTMELLDGADLDAGKIPWQEAAALLFDVASSLAILHSRGLVHRDVSSRNVRRTAEGRAKLIDFGAMTCMGVAKEVVGTPPFMPPETLALQPLDGRADLFSLGALAYYLLTGRHAYPARKLADLRDVWRSRPASPARTVPDLPANFATLVLELLALDRAARPRSAGEVMERLASIAGLPLEERIDVSRAYLTTPTLFGRDAPLLAIRTQMLSLVRGDGGTVVICGDGGSGRSRLLDACAVEGKLLGATVVRADASDGASGDWEVAQTLANQLIEALPHQAAEAARLSRDVLGHVIDVLRPDAIDSMSGAMPERSVMLRHLRDFVLALAYRRKIVIVVDDVDRIDEPSAAFLAALAHKSDRHSVMVFASCRGDSDAPSIHLLKSLATSIQLQPLDLEQTEALLRSLFGDIANLSACAVRIQALASGNPGAIMELAHHLVRSGLARYEAGSWLLPATLSNRDLPLTIGAALRGRIEALSADARDLAEILRLAEAKIEFEGCVAMTAHGDRSRAYRALDELVAARIFVTDGERYRFSQPGFRRALLEGIAPERRARLHLRIARALAERGEDVVLRARHLSEAGHEHEAIVLLCSIDLSARLPPLPLLEHALEYAKQHGEPAKVVYRLSMAVILKSSLVMAGGSFRRCVPTVIERLERESGLALYRELAHVPVGQRLSQALTAARDQYTNAAEDDRVFAPGDAVRELGRLSAAFCSMAMATFDLELLDMLPPLDPLLPASPALALLARLIEGVRGFLCGREARAVELYEEVLARIGQPDRGGLDEAAYMRMYLGQHYMLALQEANIGSDAAERRAQILDEHRAMRVAAWRVRMLLQLNRGNVEAARKCQRRAELLHVQDGGEARYAGSTAAVELFAYSQADDMLGVKSMLEALTGLAEQYAGWRPVLLFGQARYRELQGDAAGALELIRSALELAPCGHAFIFQLLAGAHVALLADLGRIDQAVRCGFEHLAAAEREGIVPRTLLLRRDFAPILARAGRHAEALEMITQAVEFGERRGAQGFALGIFHEKQAEVAMYMGDRPEFTRAFAHCAEAYKNSQNPMLTAKLARLLDRARQTGCEPSEPTRELIASLGSEATESAFNTVRSRMVECVDPDDRARCALTMLLQSADSCAGQLYGVRESDVFLLSGLPDPSLDAGMATWVKQRVLAELANGEGETQSSDKQPSHSQQAARGYQDAGGAYFDAILLIGEHDGWQRIAAVLVVQATGTPLRVPPRAMTFEIASRLLERGDVSGAVLVAASTTREG